MKSIFQCCFLFFFIFTILLISSETYAQKLAFDPPRGFFEEPFELTITAPVENAIIKYTLDGKNPLTSSNAISTPSPAKITVDPENITNRDRAPGFCVRAIAVSADTAVSNLNTHTYLFVNKIAELSPDNVKPSSEWPNPGSSRRIQAMDYGMDPDILNDVRYKDKIVPALLDIPSMSMVMDLYDLFDRDTGIYVNATERGEEWERPCSLELINPDGSDGFHINCGVRIRGGYSRREVNPKHAFRYFFNSQYGEAKLEHPLFEDEGVDIFDKIDLRCPQNYSWSYGQDDPSLNTFLREVFSRDLQRDMGQPYTRSRYYHLYINGTYWGLFQTQERSEGYFAESYLDGAREDFDVIKVDAGYQRPYILEATDGSLDSYYSLWEDCLDGFESDEKYYKVQGLNPDGTRNPDYPQKIDINNLIDYLINTYYVGDFDAPVSNFLGNQSPNNFFAIYDRVNPKGYLHFRHDGEHTMMPYMGIDLDRTGPFPAGQDKERFNPQWLHQHLVEHPEYRLRFADRVYKHFYNNGALVEENNVKRLLFRKEQIDLAIIAESARWGDAKAFTPRTRDDDWLPAVEWILDEWFPNRNDIVLNQFKDKGWYPDFDPPAFNTASGIVDINFKLTMSAAHGTIYYTMDGSDPHNPWSESENDKTSPTAKEYKEAITISKSSYVRARVLLNGSWSAVSELSLAIDEDFSPLRITEIHYKPLPEGEGENEIDGDLFEFVELKNCGSSDINLTGSSFVNGIRYNFPPLSYVKPNEFVVLCSNIDFFNQRYGFDAHGQYSGNLSNGGERIVMLSAAGDTVINVRFNDRLPWPEEADSTGQSLVSKYAQPWGNPANPEYWTISANIHGSPNSDDAASPVLTSQKKAPMRYHLYQNFPNPFNATTTIRFDVPRQSKITLNIYNALGQKVLTLLEKNMDAGQHQINWNTKGLAGGVYLLRLQTSDWYSTIKLLLIK